MPRTMDRPLSLVALISILAASMTATAQDEAPPAPDETPAATADSADAAAPATGATTEDNDGETATGTTAGTTAGATTGAATTGTAPAAATTSASTTTFAPAPEETAAAAAADAAPEEAAAADDSRGTFAFSGVRLGASIGGGFFVGSVSGGMGGLGAGLGAQFGPLGFMYKLQFFAGYAEAEGLGQNFYAAWNTIIVDYKFLRIFQIGIGPSMDFVWGCAVQACRDTGPYAGLEARFSVKLGPIKVGLGIHPTFFPNGALNTMFLYFGL